MSISQKDLKLLWGRSGNRCAICRRSLTQDSKATNAAYALGEQAHIVGEMPGAARGNSPLSEADRNAYHNLILLCPNHHTEIDKAEEDWPVERLHKQKVEHELWVTETLNEAADVQRNAQDASVASIIDAAVANCLLENWERWTRLALSPHPRWPIDLPDNLFRFRQQVVAAIWPEHLDELKRATTTLSITLHRAAQKFLEHAEPKGDMLVEIRFYKVLEYNPNYDRDAVRYEKWIDDTYELLHEATKAANWFADAVRRDFNPMFFITSGKFMVTEGPFEDLQDRSYLLEYSQEEKDGLPSALLA